MKKIALLGLGIMGSGMAHQLLKAGFPLTVYNRTREKAELLRSAGATIGETPADAAESADVVISMLADDVVSRELWMSKQGALNAIKPSTILIESGTVTPDWISELNKAATEKGCVLLDAPVTGSKVHAESGELSFLVGGDENVLEDVRQVLMVMGKKVVHVGPSGSGSRLKLINNFLCAVQLSSLAEAMGWIEHSGINVEVALEVLNTGAPGSPLLKTMSQRMIKRDYQVNFLLKLLGKDVEYAIRDADLFDIQLKSGKSALQLISTAKDKGYGEQDMSSIVEQFRAR